MAVIQSSAPGEGYKKITIDLDKSMIDALIAALNFYKGV